MNEDIRILVDAVIEAHRQEPDSWNWAPSGIELFTRRTRRRRLLEDEDPKPYHPLLNDLSDKAGILAVDYVCQQIALPDRPPATELAEHIRKRAGTWKAAETLYRERLQQRKRAPTT